jgi:hypothetical protein
MRHGVAAALFCACAFSAHVARADFTCPTADHGREKKARSVFEEAVQIEASDPEGALLRYQCAGRLADRPAIQLRIGVVAERLGKDDIAIAAFERYLELAGASAPDVESMRQHVRELRDKRAKATAPTPSRSNASPDPPPPPKREEPPPSDPMLTYLGWGLVGVGAVSGIIGTGFLIDAKSKSDKVQDLPEGTTWASPEAEGRYDSATTSQTIGIVFLALAPALIGAGIVALYVGNATPPWATASRPFAVRF